jgi:hypothetical protein
MESTYQKANPFPCSQIVVYLSVPSEASLRFSQRVFFMGWGCQPHAQPPTWRTRVSLLVWAITFDLSGKGNPTSRYATAGTAFRIIWPRKPRHYVKVETPSGWTSAYILRYVHPVCPQVSARLPLNWIPWNFILTHFIKICRINPNFPWICRISPNFPWICRMSPNFPWRSK